MFLQVNQAVNQAISSAVPLPAAIAIPMSTDIGINAKTMDGGCCMACCHYCSMPLHRCLV
jgi:hypothetical protein